MKYVSRVEVVYGDNTNAIDGEDINKGFGSKLIDVLHINSSLILIVYLVSTEYVYLVAKYTEDSSKAASGFSVHTTYVEDLDANDIAKGDGLDLYRYIHNHYYYENSDMPLVGSVYLKEDVMGDGHTDDLNKDRGGRFLYLCWTYVE